MFDKVVLFVEILLEDGSLVYINILECCHYVAYTPRPAGYDWDTIILGISSGLD